MTLLVLSCLVTFQTRGPKEPAYQGRLISEWIIESFAPPAAKKNEDSSRKALQAVGTNALPYLLHLFAVTDAPLTRKVSSWVSKISNGRVQYFPKERAMRIASRGLQLLGTNAIPALPTLGKYLDDSWRGQYAPQSMTGCGRAALPYLTKASASTNELLASEAATALGELATEIDDALPPLIEMLKSTNRSLRRTVVFRLINEKLPASLVVPALMKACEDSDESVQMLAAYALSAFKTNAHIAIPVLQRLTRSTNATAARSASNTLLKLNSATGPPP